jgi:hypothetical protein
MLVLQVYHFSFYEPANQSIAEKMSKMEEEGTEKWTDQQLAEIIMEFSGIDFFNSLTTLGKMLLVGWKATKLEVIQVIR